MRRALWPEHSVDVHRGEIRRLLRSPVSTATYVVEGRPGTLHGFAELSVRAYADGCESRPVGYLEGWYVDPEHRRSGVGRALVDAGLAWAARQGLSEFASDAYLSNRVSRRAHRALGFEVTEVLVHFRKRL